MKEDIVLTWMFLFVATFGGIEGQFLLLKGKIRGGDVDVPVLGHVQFNADQDNPESSIEVSCDSTGAFAVSIPKPMPSVVNFWAAGYSGHSISLLTHLEDTVEIDVRLTQTPILSDLSNIMIGYRFDSTAQFNKVPMTRRDDGLYSARITMEKPEVEFGVFDIARHGQSIVMGTNATFMRYHGKNPKGYVAVLESRDSVVDIVFDPFSLPTAHMPGTISFSSAHSVTALFAQRYDYLEQSYFDFTSSLQDLQRKGEAQERILLAWADSAKALKMSIVEESNSLLRSQLFLAYFRLVSIYGMHLDTIFARQEAKSIPLSSPVWYFYHYEAHALSKVVSAKSSFLEELFDNNPNPGLRAFILFETARDAQFAMDEVKLLTLYARLKEEFGKTFWARVADRFIMPNMSVKVGAEIPDFLFKDMRDTTRQYSKKDLRGRFYLLDFWATWCLPCIGEIPNLTEAYQSFGAEAITIISISCDSSAAKVEEFQKRRFPMAWPNVWVSPQRFRELERTFEITGIPKPILVGPDMKILAIKNELRGELLMITLRKFLDR